MGLRDKWSGFSFLQALPPQDFTTGSVNGTTIDRQGYDSVTFIVNVGAVTSAGSMSNASHKIMLEHGLESALGVSVWSEVYPSQMLHSVYGLNGTSTLDSGVFQLVASYTDASAAYAIGYIGPRRYIRIRISDTAAPSVMSAGAIAILGLPSNWPVNDTPGEV